jgi:hypothetical protein
MQAENITPIQSLAEIQVQYGTIQSSNDRNYQILGHSGTCWATPAFSCLVKPMTGDRVLFSTDTDGQGHILSIVERLDSTETNLYFPGDVTLNAQGQLHLNGQQGINMSSQQQINLVSEEYSLIAKKALFGVDSISAFGSKLVAKISHVQTIADTVETVADHCLQKLKNSFRLIEGVDQQRAGDVIHTVKNLYSMRSRQATILAKKDIKIDAERIHMG